MLFRTEIPLPSSPFQLSLKDKLVTLGSCFAENMGNRLSDLKLGTYNNPFGTIYNPLSLFKLICAAICPDEAGEFQFVEREGRWFCYDVHSRISAESQEELQQLINLEVETLTQKLRDAKVLMLTLGTGWVYELNETGQTVANCHKMPAELFTRRLLEAEEIVTGFAELFSQIKNLNPDLQVVLTVSPVRHLKDTLVLNQVSKSVLRLAAHHLTELLPDVHYFPAYELQLDDLRDYRFYADDLLHPSAQAIQYIWEKFSRVYFSHELQAFAAEWEKISQALHHRPFHLESVSHQAFIQSTLNRIEGLAAMFRVDLKAEAEQLRKQLIAQKTPPVSSRKTKKAHPELVALIQSVANSEIMREEEPVIADLPVSDIIAEPEIHAVLDEPVAEAIDIDALQQLAEELELQLEENEPPVELPATSPEGISKAKKRRNKRKAKKLAAREAAIAAAVEMPETTDTNTSEIIPEHTAITQLVEPTAETASAPVVRKPRGKAATRKAASAMNSLLSVLADVKITPPQPEVTIADKLADQLPQEPGEPAPAPPKPARKPRGKAKPEQPTLDFNSLVPAVDTTPPAAISSIAEPAPQAKETKPVKEPKKPAAKRAAPSKKKVVLKKKPAKTGSNS